MWRIIKREDPYDVVPVLSNIAYNSDWFCFVGNRSTSECPPGWYKVNHACFLFYFQQQARWGDARSSCHRLGADLAVVNNATTLEAIASQRKQLKFDDHELLLGLSGQLKWIWPDRSNLSGKLRLWGPGEPSGDGKCGSFLNAISWDSAWLGYGWRWNDEKCTNRKGYICEEPLGGFRLLTIWHKEGIKLAVCRETSRYQSLIVKCSGIIARPVHRIERQTIGKQISRTFEPSFCFSMS